MAKTSSAWIESRPAPRRNLLGRFVLGLMMVAIAPLAFDGLKVCYANWMAMNDRHVYIETPAFEALYSGKRELIRQSWLILGPILRDPPWKAGTTIFLAAGWAVAVGWLFRSGHR